jgi:hypothetical protein
MRSIRVLVAVFTLVTFALLVPASAQNRVRFHVFTQADPSGLLDEAGEERVKAVADIKARLSKNPQIELVDRREDARVTVEVLSAGAEDGGQGSSLVVPVDGAAIVTAPGKKFEFVGRARLTSGTFTTNLESSVGPFGRSYGENLARKVEDWMKKNGAALGTQPTK